MKKQAMNPFLPLDEYIPDGEPHIFGERIYLYGSHDTEGGTRYCAEGNYVCHSAPLDDLSDWRYEGVIFESAQNPYYQKDAFNDLYAPDVVKGNDGRYYLYYGLEGQTATSGHNMIHVAVSDKPAGKYEHYGFVKNEDGTPYRKYLDDDPAVMNDDGVIRLYHGWSLSTVAAKAHASERKGHRTPVMPEPGSAEMKYALKPAYQMLFNRTDEEIMALEEPLMGANTVRLKEDMLTIAEEPHRIVPGQYDTPKESSFYGHAFYEASSIRKINGIYYFIYSSENSNELCYATSKYPDRDFLYRGVIISNGDVGYEGRKKEDRLNMTANNHGSLECVKGQWYIFYHRQTHNSTYSRQACAEPVEILEDGSIRQVQCTSCGLNKGPLLARGTYEAAYACNITNGHMPHATNRIVNADIPYITHDHDIHFITNIKEETLIGYKYFAFEGNYVVSIKTRGNGAGKFLISTQENCEQEVLGGIEVSDSAIWEENSAEVEIKGTQAFYLKYKGEGSKDLLSITFTMK